MDGALLVTEALLSSKTMRLVLVTMGLIVVIFVAAAAATVLFDVQLPYVTDAFYALTGQAGIGAARNAYVDGPRRLEADRQAYQLPASLGGVP